MSGGFAYVYDPHDRLPARLNKDMVELDSLSADDTRWLRDVLGRYLSETESSVAARILDNLDGQAALFVKVVPTDYRRALEAASAAEGEPGTAAAIMMAAAHG
jgi:glutamate synthase (NADPH/NADH) large chain